MTDPKVAIITVPKNIYNSYNHKKKSKNVYNKQMQRKRQNTSSAEGRLHKVAMKQIKPKEKSDRSIYYQKSNNFGGYQQIPKSINSMNKKEEKRSSSAAS